MHVHPFLFAMPLNLTLSGLPRRHLCGWALCVCALASGGVLAAPASAVTVDGQRFEAQSEVGGVTVRLNGVGLRATAWIKGYAAGLYLPRTTESAEAVMHVQQEPRRVQLRMLLNAPAEEFAKAFRKGVTRNVNPAQLPELEGRMRDFEATIRSLGQLRKADVIDLDLIPSEGLVLRHNGKAVGAAVAGVDLYVALLAIFVGPKPLDKEMKIGLLDGPVA